MTNIADQYRTITRQAGWVDRSARGRIRFAGPDALSFLQGLLTNDLSLVAPGRGIYAAWLTPLGRMVADIVVLQRGDELLGLVGDGQGPVLASRLDLLIFTENVTVADATVDLADIEVTGARAAEVVAAATGASPGVLSTLTELSHVDVADGLVVRTGDSTLPDYRIIVDSGARERIVAGLEQAGAIAIAPELGTALRIEAGRGEWGRDLGDDVIPLEAGLLDRAISTSKGCYVGQEIVIRILHRGGGRVAKRLVTLAFDPAVSEVPAARTAIEADGAAVGYITSAAFSPARGAVVALGYLQRDAAEAGRQVHAAGAPATVTGIV